MACICSRKSHILKVYGLECTGYYIQSTQEEVHLLEGVNVSDESDLSVMGLGQPRLFYYDIAVAGARLSLNFFSQIITLNLLPISAFYIFAQTA